VSLRDRLLDFLYSDCLLGTDRYAGLASQAIRGSGYPSLFVVGFQDFGRAHIHTLAAYFTLILIYLR